MSCPRSHRARVGEQFAPAPQQSTADRAGARGGPHGRRGFSHSPAGQKSEAKLRAEACLCGLEVATFSCVLTHSSLWA